MKNYSFFILILLLSINLSAQNAEKEITQVLDNWHNAAAEANFKTYFSLMTDDAIFIGTDPTENWNKKEFIEVSI
ncbi:nuclear transport factor 2 family protein [Mesonia sp. K4-1]|uniref:nuclear transport factor 2 family protein n=1 Tax=Mesonia sp. K4-1 TaxID=2602760 RepID=UPI0011CC7971|nr:nuclear transport factor 2 family protein [Mesonia sp. K4-1]TXK75832.1 nuclear transport factor 2 family protein [Mesonia sp. K4-1]